MPINNEPGAAVTGTVQGMCMDGVALETNGQCELNNIVTRHRFSVNHEILIRHVTSGFTSSTYQFGVYRFILWVPVGKMVTCM